MEEKQERQEKKPFVEPKLIKGDKLDEVTFQPGGGYLDPPQNLDTVHEHHTKII
jgi:hypothetical protein